MRNNNLFQIWKSIGKITPFAARRQGWTDAHYVVVEEIKIRKWPYGDAIGYPFENGKQNDHFEYNEDWREKRAIPSAGTYQWEIALEVDLGNADEIVQSIDNLKKQSIKNAKVLSRKDSITFGKYKGKELGELIEINPGYIAWAIQKMDNFIVDPVLLDQAPKRSISRAVIELNEEKLDIHRLQEQN